MHPTSFLDEDSNKPIVVLFQGTSKSRFQGKRNDRQSILSKRRRSPEDVKKKKLNTGGGSGFDIVPQLKKNTKFRLTEKTTRQDSSRFLSRDKFSSTLIDSE